MHQIIIQHYGAFWADERGMLKEVIWPVEEREIQMAADELKPGDRVIIAGAALGLAQASAACIVGPTNIFGYEPDPNNLKLARQVGVDGILIDVEYGALASKNGTAKFYYPGDADETWATGQASTTAKVGREVPALEINEQIRRRKANVLILDVEGAEEEILNVLDVTPLRAILLEYHPMYVAEGTLERFLDRVQWKIKDCEEPYTGTLLLTLVPA